MYLLAVASATILLLFIANIEREIVQLDGVSIGMINDYLTEPSVRDPTGQGSP